MKEASRTKYIHFAVKMFITENISDKEAQAELEEGVFHFCDTLACTVERVETCFVQNCGEAEEAKA